MNPYVPKFFDLDRHKREEWSVPDLDIKERLARIEKFQYLHSATAIGVLLIIVLLVLK